MYVASAGALLPQETSVAQEAAAIAKMISLMDFINIGLPFQDNAHMASSNIEKHSSGIIC